MAMTSDFYVNFGNLEVAGSSPAGGIRISTFYNFFIVIIIIVKYKIIILVFHFLALNCALNAPFSVCIEFNSSNNAIL